MAVVIWLIIIACFILSFVGIIFPIIPSPLVLWLAFLAYFFFLNEAELTLLFWLAMVVLTIILVVSDIIANSYFVKKYGGSKWGERMAAIGVIVGSFVIPPFGIIVVPFLAVLVTELMQKRSTSDSVRAAIGSLFGFLGGSFAKIIIQLVMIVWFFMVVF
ncbi:DUF456 domain-containing protein [Aquibacillus salsiterrae]|uniref:DUF456 domain-containing protein n=1 Tax=Aquibacillus salsiterrae TaxID=2950439 RepID=A0A9X4AER0_9BACI|nr:DUF456 domain-containing protein [Aquibacillus salsiterrae]MDC3417086.1 DUF456 domain-containing protein [Aquibacillus salsiterrae]